MTPINRQAKYAIVMIIGIMVAACGPVGSTMSRPHVRWYVEGIPESRPTLIAQSGNERMPATALRRPGPNRVAISIKEPGYAAWPIDFAHWPLGWLCR